MKFSSKFFENADCEYHPCHTIQPINCLFCFCPLYFLGEGCGGMFRLTESGAKDCSGCVLPHGIDGYEYVMRRLESNKNDA